MSGFILGTMGQGRGRREGGPQPYRLMLKWTNGLSVSALAMDKLGNQPTEAVRVAAVGPYTEFIRVYLGKTPHFPKPPPSCDLHSNCSCVYSVTCMARWKLCDLDSDRHRFFFVSLFIFCRSRCSPSYLTLLSIYVSATLLSHLLRCNHTDSLLRFPFLMKACL